MFQKIRVLVVDDSAFIRKVVSDMINSQPDMEVIDVARDGEIAVEKVKLLNPDVVTLDIEMPNKNGLEALKVIKQVSKSQVIMLSSLTTQSSTFTIEALHSGAFDFITKPSGSISLDIDKVKDQLVEKIRYANSFGKRPEIPKQVPSQPIKTKTTGVRCNNKKIEAILLGASTGGPKVLYDIITNLPESLNVPVFVVQHMPAGFTKAFAERINRNSRLTVVEAKDRDRIQANTVYIAPGGYHMLVAENFIKLDLSPQIHGVRPAVDKLFVSATNIYKGNMVACIFTGMGKDGADGVKLIKKMGGYIIAQDEATSVVYGMPKAAYDTGCVDVVLPDNKIVNEIIRAVRRMGD